MTSDAHAADFTGRIRRIRIREQQGGTSFRNVVQTESSDPSDQGSLEVTVAGLETDQTTTVVGTAKSTRAIISATATFAKVHPLEDKYTMTAPGTPTATISA